MPIIETDVDKETRSVYTFTSKELDEYITKHSYEWALDACIEGLRLLNLDMPKVAKEYLRMVIWSHTGSG